MKNLNIASWNLKDNYFNIKEDNRKIKAILEFLADEDIDVLALQNVNRRLLLKLNYFIKQTGYHIDHINEDNYTILDRMMGYEKNPVIIRDDYINVSDVYSVSGLLVNKLYITDRNKLGDKFMLINTSLKNPDGFENIDILAEFINNDEFSININAPILLMGDINISHDSIEMSRLKFKALNKNNMRIVHTNQCDKKKNEYLITGGFDIYVRGTDLKHQINEYSKPMYAKVKMK